MNILCGFLAPLYHSLCIILYSFMTLEASTRNRDIMIVTSLTYYAPVVVNYSHFRTTTRSRTLINRFIITIARLVLGVLPYVPLALSMLV